LKIEWSPRAERELTELRDYIAQDSPFFARHFTERLIQAIERLTSMPRSSDGWSEAITRWRSSADYTFVNPPYGPFTPLY